MTVSPRCSSGRISTVAPRRSRKRAGPAADLVDAGLRVAAAVDVDERGEVLEVGRQLVLEDLLELGELVGADRRAGGDAGNPSGRSLSARGGRCRRSSAALSCPDRAPRRDPPARGTQRLPARAGGQGRGRRRPAADLVRPAPARVGTRSSSSAGRCRRATGRTRSPRSSAWIRRLRAEHGEGRGGPRRPPLVRSGALDRHLPVDRRRARPGDRRGGARPRRAERLAGSVGPADRDPGAAARALASPDRRREHDAAVLDPRRRPADPDRLDQRHERQEHGHPADHPHPRAGRPARRDDDVGRRPRRRAAGRARRLDGAGRRRTGSSAGSDVDVAVLETARGGIVLRGVGYESNDASVLTNVSSDHLDLQGIHTLPELAEVKATIARITRPDGWVVLNADDPLVAAVARRVRAQVALFSLDESTIAGRPPALAARRPGVRRPARYARRGRGRRGDPDRRPVTEVPIAIGGIARHNVANALAAAGGARALGATIEQVADGLRDFRPTSDRSPGPAQPVPARSADRDRRLRPQRGGGRGGPRRRRGHRRRVRPAGPRRSR